MEVAAIAVGFYGQLRQVGDVFDVPKGSKASWFKPTKPDGKSDGAKDQRKPDSAEEQLS